MEYVPLNMLNPLAANLQVYHQGNKIVSYNFSFTAQETT